MSSVTLLIVKEEFNKSELEVTYINISYTIGALLGAIFFGYISEAYGRRRVSLLTASLYILCSIANVFIHNWTALLILR